MLTDLFFFSCLFQFTRQLLFNFSSVAVVCMHVLLFVLLLQIFLSHCGKSESSAHAHLSNFWREIQANIATCVWNVKGKNKMEACVSGHGPLSPSPASCKRSLTNFSLLYLLSMLLCRLSGALSAQLSAEKSLVFGPGVHPERVGFPVNYFYIQAVDTKGKK